MKSRRKKKVGEKFAEEKKIGWKHAKGISEYGCYIRSWSCLTEVCENTFLLHKEKKNNKKLLIF